VRLSLILVAGGLFVLLGALVLCPGTLQASDGTSPNAPGYQLLVNQSVEEYDPPYTQYQGANCQAASGWDRFWYDGAEPYWMDTIIYDKYLGCHCFVERIDGATSQLVFSTEPYTAGLQQQVTGLTPGVGYGFHAAMLTIFRSSGGEVVDGTMIKQIGIDPTGGSDPQAATVLWSEPDDHDEGPWDIDQRIAAFAESPTMTVFIRVISLYESGSPSDRNLSFLDSAILAQTPYVRASSPASSDVPSFVVEWDNVVPAPGGAELKWLDVQWLDEVDGLWHDWLLKTNGVQATFTGQMGHTYRFRARAFQRYPNGAHLYSPYRPEGDTVTRLGGPLVVGTVQGSEGQPVSGATVAIPGTACITTSDFAGHYSLELPLTATSETLTVSHPHWLAPAPVYDLFLGPTETATITWTLRPVDDAIANGGFESDLDGWTLTATLGLTPEVVAQPAHTGYGAVALGGTLSESLQSPEGGLAATALQAVTAGTRLTVTPSATTVRISQTVVLTDAWAPVLSFWYRAGSGDAAVVDGEDSFRVVLTVVTQTISTTLPLTSTITPTLPVSLTASVRLPVTDPITSTPPVTEPITCTVKVTTTQILSPSLGGEGWQYVWTHVGPPDAALTGTVTVDLEVRNDGDEVETTVFVDEVSLGSTLGAPHKVYLPMILRPVNPLQ
jgi:hypothetical protein